MLQSNCTNVALNVCGKQFIARDTLLLKFVFNAQSLTLTVSSLFSNIHWTTREQLLFEHLFRRRRCCVCVMLTKAYLRAVPLVALLRLVFIKPSLSY